MPFHPLNSSHPPRHTKYRVNGTSTSYHAVFLQEHLPNPSRLQLSTRHAYFRFSRRDGAHRSSVKVRRSRDPEGPALGPRSKERPRVAMEANMAETARDFGEGIKDEVPLQVRSFLVFVSCGVFACACFKQLVGWTFCILRLKTISAYR